MIRRHTLIGEQILAASPALAGVARIVRSTHERVDGGGYPDGLAGSEIPLAARIISVCAAYDAMVSPRPYRQSLSAERAQSELRRCAGAQFEARIVEVFIALADVFEDGKDKAREADPRLGTAAVG